VEIIAELKVGFGGPVDCGIQSDLHVQTDPDLLDRGNCSIRRIFCNVFVG
jgi:hypothetical protein